MAAYPIICITSEEPHGHVVSVSTGGESGRPDWTWPVSEVLRALAAGESFYTVSPTTGERVEVEATRCPFPGCSVKTLRSSADDHRGLAVCE